MGSVQNVKAAAGDETLSSGSFIVNMGISPQSNANALKPYGMIYDLIRNYNVPIKWIIKSSKGRDGIDFTHNSTSYKGGAFIIPAEFISTTIASRINYWQGQGISGAYSTSALSLPVYATLSTFPLVMIDSLSSNQDIIETYYSNASIPASAYTIGTPAGLTQCYDVWTNPHGDPTWASHYYLYDFVTVQKSWIWAECHSVSMMEYCKSGSQQLNFLSSNGLQCYGSGKCGANPETHTKAFSSPFSYFYPAEPVMQFIGDAHNASSGGSERWYIPLSSGQWNSNTRRGITTGNGSSPKEGTVLVYGPAFNNTSNGWVMYQGGHDLNSSGGSTDRVAAQRAYFNFILLAGTAKQVNVTATIPSNLNVGQSAGVNSTATSGTAPYSYQWTSSLGGIFQNASDSSTVYTAPVVMADTMDVIQIKVTDQCGRVNFYYKYVNIGSSPLPVELLSFTADRKSGIVQLNWSTESEINNDYFSIERSGNGESWNLIGKVKGKGNSSNSQQYSLIDRDPLKEVSYYRLSQTDYDGTSQGFRVLRLNPDRSFSQKGNILNVSPNPFSETFSFELSNSNDEYAEMTIFSSQGEVILKKTYTLRSGTNKMSYTDNATLSEGVYFMALKTQSGKLMTSKIIKR